jgi:lipopolysaccharide transport system permease protein
VSGHRYLFAQLVRRELRRKYKGSSLGVLWYLINPLVLLGAYTLMFGHVFRLQHFADYPIFLMAGLMAWTFFAQSLLAAAESLIDQGGIVRRARFPRETIPAAAVTVQLATFAAILVILVPLSLALRGSREPASLLLLPLLVVLLFGVCAGLRPDRLGAARLLPRRGPDPRGGARRSRAHAQGAAARPSRRGARRGSGAAARDPVDRPG